MPIGLTIQTFTGLIAKATSFSRDRTYGPFATVDLFFETDEGPVLKVTAFTRDQALAHAITDAVNEAVERHKSSLIQLDQATEAA